MITQMADGAKISGLSLFNSLEFYLQKFASVLRAKTTVRITMCYKEQRNHLLRLSTRVSPQ